MHNDGKNYDGQSVVRIVQYVSLFSYTLLSYVFTGVQHQNKVTRC